MDGSTTENKEEAKVGVEEFWNRNARMENVEGEFDERFREYVEGFVRDRREEGRR